ncbi:hypothetical protein CSB09_03570 [Candidatus Gracilibacteria bacterium]|nr:MAG: hypothetical protein CSB09_03570 [Candidatus Gracilibacteria bacterium]
MIQIVPISHNVSQDTSHIRSHVLSPEKNITIVLILKGEKENILSIIEDQLLETISSTVWEGPKSDADFTYITEHYNHHIKNFDDNDVENTSILLAVLKENTLIVSTIGDAGAFLVDGESITQITSEDTGKYEFSALTNGEITQGATIFLASQNIQTLLGNELLQEMSNLDKDAFDSIVTSVLKREVSQSVHLMRIRHPRKRSNLPPRGENKNYINIARSTGKRWIHSLRQHKAWHYAQEKIRRVINIEDKRQQYIFLGIGMVILFLLIFMLVKGISEIFTGVPQKIQTQIQQAQTLVNESRTLTNNQEAFEKKINEAQEILLELRRENMQTKEVQKLETTIDILKKETYDIQTIDLTQANSLVETENVLEPIGVVEKDKKLTIIGKRKLILDVVRDSGLPEVIEYPQGNEARYFAVNDAGKIYITTDTNRVLSPAGKSVNYVNVTGQNGWSFLGPVSTYYSNIYFVSPNADQILKHKPGVNNKFSQKENSLPNTLPGIIDIGIDGGFYILMESGKINRYVSTNKKGITPLTLNKIPNTWSINANESAQIIVSDKLSYVYIQNGKRVWIFQPNSRQFQDITALDYIAQLEIKTNEKLESITVPRDGLIYATTAKGVFEIQFEIIDGNLTIRQ